MTKAVPFQQFRTQKVVGNLREKKSVRKFFISGVKHKFIQSETFFLPTVNLLLFFTELETETISVIFFREKNWHIWPFFARKKDDVGSRISMIRF